MGSSNRSSSSSESSNTRSQMPSLPRLGSDSSAQQTNADELKNLTAIIAGKKNPSTSQMSSAAGMAASGQDFSGVDFNDPNTLLALSKGQKYAPGVFTKQPSSSYLGQGSASANL